MLALVLVSCTSDELTGPQAPDRMSAALVPGAPLIITEFMANPGVVDDNKGEWIEIYNPSTDPVDLRNYRLSSASGTTVVRPGVTTPDTWLIDESVVVAPGAYIVVGNNADTESNGGVAVAYRYGGTLATLPPNLGNNTTDWLTLKAPDGSLVDSVAYSPSTINPTTFARTLGTPTYSPASGSSRALINLDGDNTIASGSNWANSISTFGAGDRGTPGEANFGGAAVAVSVRATTFVTPGTSFNVTALATDVDGKPSLTTFTWTISDPSIATIDPATGRVTGVATGADGMAGIVTVTATSANGISGTGTVFVVNPGDVASVSISVNDPARVPVGYTKPAFPTIGTTSSSLPTPVATLVWTSSDDNIATVSQLGYITAVAPGVVTIKATAPNGVFGVVPFTVIPSAAPPASVIYRNHVEFGAPLEGSSAGTLLLEKPQFILSFDPVRGGPRWVSWNINKTQFGAAPRCDCFSADLTLPASVYHVVDFDYRNSGYDRGHIVQSESRTATEQENATTFLLTNILPQAGQNNQGPWSKLENALNDSARLVNREIYVMAGGMYRPADEAPTLKNEGKVAIPDYTWKVAVIMAGGKGRTDVASPADLQVIAIKMPNLTEAHAALGEPAYAGSTAAGVSGIRNDPWQNYATDVNAIELETGLDLLALLPDHVEWLVEGGLASPTAATTEQLFSILSGGLQDLVEDGLLSTGNASALQTQLSDAQAQLAAGDAATARETLAAFRRTVQALERAGRISAATATALTTFDAWLIDATRR